jgi:uncharacterized damage-inducible protein DinB
MQNSFIISLFEHKAWCNRRLVAALRAAPPDVGPGRMAVILLTLDHTSIIDQTFRSRLLGEPVGFSAVVAREVPNLERLGVTLAEIDDWYLNYVSNVSATELESPIDFVFIADGEAATLTKGQMLAHVVTHGASHRAAINTQLTNLDVTGAPDGMVTTLHWNSPTVDR